MNINPTEMLRLKDKIHLLNQIGISIEPFGLNTIKIDSIPLFVKESNEEVYIEELISQVISKDKIDLDSLRKHVISTFACKFTEDTVYLRTFFAESPQYSGKRLVNTVI